MENLINGLKTNRSFAVSSLLVLALLALAAAAPVLSPYDPVEATMQNAYLEPLPSIFLVPISWGGMFSAVSCMVRVIL